MTLKNLDNKIAALKEFRDSIYETIEAELKDNANIIIDMNIISQLFELGITSEGIDIASYRPYRPNTISIKIQKNQPTDRVTLRDTGDFYNSFRIVFEDDKFTIMPTDSKTASLIHKYGDDIIGLTDENKNELIWAYAYGALLKKRDSLL